MTSPSATARNVASSFQFAAHSSTSMGGSLAIPSRSFATAANRSASGRRSSSRAGRTRSRADLAQLRERVRQAEVEYRAIIESLPLLTWLSVPGDRSSCLYISPHVETMLGYSPAEWRAEPRLFARLLHPEDSARVLAEHERGVDNGGPLRCEYRLIAREGRTVWIREETSIVRDAIGKPLYAQTFLVDVSERKRANEEQERLRAAERTASHLRTVRQRRLELR